MRNSWRHFFRRVAAVSVCSGTLAWSSALCFAQLAYDDASDPVYSDGWQAGDDGGTGSFGPWNFEGTYASTDQQRIDDGLKTGSETSNPFNNIGRAWTMFNPVVETGAGGIRDIARAGRSIDPLQPGQTVRLVIDNPWQRQFFRGYSIKFNSGGGNICYNAGCTPDTMPVLKYKVEQFDYFNYGQWYDTTGEFELYARNDPAMSQVGTDVAGAQIDFKLVTPTTYEMTMTPLQNPAAAVTMSGELDNPGESGPIDWIELQMFNTQTDLAPDAVVPESNTDLYIRSMAILGDDPGPAGVPGDYNDNGVVDAADYVVWRNGGPLQNEVAGVSPGTVTAEDYAAWRARFGNVGAVPSAGSLSAAAVPEAHTFVYLAAGVAGLLAMCPRTTKK
jgi:hypothetical protein